MRLDGISYVNIMPADPAQQTILLLTQMISFDSDHIPTMCNDDGTHQEVPPILQFPTEILSKIFVFCLPDVYEGDNYRYQPIERGSFSMRVAPLQLCNVCSRWRSVVLWDSKLWTLLQLSPRRINKRLIDRIHTWFSRAGTLPLTVQINLKTWERASNKRVLKALLQYVSRWEFIQTNMIFPPAKRSKSINAPLLRTWHSLHEDVGIPLSSAPLLKDVYLNNLDDPPSSVHSIPWHQLTILKIIEGPTLSTAMDVMQLCRMLEVLWIKIESDDYDEDDEALPQPIKMAELRTLHLSSYPDLRTLLERLILPMLVEFSLGDYHCFDHTEMDADSCYMQLLGIFDRSKCKLRTLKVVNCNFDSSQILECLCHHSCTTITDLTIASVPMITDELFIQLIASVDRKEQLLPNLTKLTVSMTDNENVSPGLLGQMVLSRREGQAELVKLELFALTTSYCIHETDRLLLKKAQESGMTLELHDGDSEGDDSEREEPEDSSTNEEDAGSNVEENSFDEEDSSLDEEDSSSDEEDTSSDEEDTSTDEEDTSTDEDATISDEED